MFPSPLPTSIYNPTHRTASNRTRSSTRHAVKPKTQKPDSTKKKTHPHCVFSSAPTPHMMRLNNPNRYTDPFGYVSSGSEHDAVLHHHGQDDESPSLSDLVECFLEQDYTCCSRSNEAMDSETPTDSGSNRSEPCLNSKRVLDELLNPNHSDSYKRMLESHVEKAIETLARFGSRGKQASNRNVMYFLRKLGHNAAICKSKWESSGSSLAAGHYEFIDVEITTKTSKLRYLVDLNFAAEFEIARPTEHYSILIDSLPKTIVATEDQLKTAIKVVAEEAKRSLKSRDLHLPPWRKNRYMQMKWLGQYKRTTNLFPTCPPLLPIEPAVNCTRFVGFEVGFATEDVNSRYIVRTR